MTEHIDTGWVGSPAAMAAALTALGWEPTPTDAAPPRHPAVLGFTPVQRAQIGGQDVWFCMVRSTAALALPAGVTLAPSWLTAAAVGEFAGLAPPRERTKNTLTRRMTDAELMALDALLEAAPLRARMEWRDATVIEIDRPDVRAMAEAAFGAARASEILS